MARNTNPWFKLFYRDWMESQRVRRMHPASQGLYLRALCFQAMHGSLPTDREEIAICLQVKPAFIEEYWEEVLHHLQAEDAGDEVRLYNQRQRDILNDAEDQKEARRRGAEKTNEKRSASHPNNRYAQRTTERALRASDSVSVSISDSEDDIKLQKGSAEGTTKPKPAKTDHLGYDNPAFCEFMALWPRRLKRDEAYRAYRKHVKTTEQHQALIAKSNAVLKGEFSSRPLDKIPYPATWINGSDWRDKGAELQPKASLTPGERKAQAHVDRIQKYDASKAEPLQFDPKDNEGMKY